MVALEPIELLDHYVAGRGSPFRRSLHARSGRRSDEHCRGRKPPVSASCVGSAASATPMPKSSTKGVVTAKHERIGGTPNRYAPRLFNSLAEWFVPTMGGVICRFLVFRLCHFLHNFTRAGPDCG